jgi:hypothetical protein
MDSIFEIWNPYFLKKFLCFLLSKKINETWKYFFKLKKTKKIFGAFLLIIKGKIKI